MIWFNIKLKYILIQIILLILYYIKVYFCAKLYISIQPNNNNAGEIFKIQPEILLLNDNGDLLLNENNGQIQVSIGNNPSNYAIIRPNNNIFQFINGKVKCSNLYINEIGIGYTLLFISMYHGLQIESNPFNILLGPSYKLSILTQPGIGYGGTLLNPQPVIAIQDIGGNIITNTNNGMVQIEILNNPVNGQLTPLSACTASIQSGIARFQYLSINKAGSPYTLRFTINILLPGGSIVDSFPFSIGIGTASSLSFLYMPNGGKAGLSFPLQPVIEIKDAGGNRLILDNTSKIRVTIDKNPSKGTLYPKDQLESNSIQGVVIFRNLYINKVGHDYTLSFLLLQKIKGKTTYIETDIILMTSTFDIELSMPYKLIITSLPSGAISDGQPFSNQPKLELHDYGDNLLINENTATMTATIIHSPGVVSSIIIDTTLSPITVITSVEAKQLVLPNGLLNPYGIGTEIIIIVYFSQEITISVNKPLLLLETGIMDRSAICLTSFGERTKEIKFLYTVMAGDISSDLNYVNTQSFQLNGGFIKDNNNNNVNVILPDILSSNSLGSTSNIIIDTTTVTIVSLSCNDPGNGEYGINQNIYIIVTFSAQVVLTGMPCLSLDMTSGNPLTQIACYISGSGTNKLVFKYTIKENDMVLKLDITKPIQLLNGSTIKRFATNSIDNVQLVTTGTNIQNFGINNNIIIDTSIVTIDSTIGIKSNVPDGIYYPGDEITIQIPFTKPVIVTGIPQLILEANPMEIRLAEYDSGSNTNMLTFRYIVNKDDTHGSTGNQYLNYKNDNAMILPNSLSSIMRYVTPGNTPISMVSLSLTLTTLNNKSLKDNNKIKIDGSVPFIINISFLTSDINIKTRGDIIDIIVSFSSTVSVNTFSGLNIPYIILSLNGIKKSRNAYYVSGSNSAALIFRYIVSLGDTSANLDYESTLAFQLNGGKIRKLSSNPMMDVDLTLPIPSGSLSLGNMIINPSIGFIVIITSLITSKEVDTYGVNEIFEIIIHFTDEVIVNGNLYLKLNTGNDNIAYYSSGSGTKSLIFIYTVITGSSTLNLNKLDDQSLVCNINECSIKDLNNINVQLDLLNINLNPSNIIINTTPPSVVSIYSSTIPPVINDNTFVAGDYIDIIIKMNFPVFIPPISDILIDHVPLLKLETGMIDQEVPFYQYGTKLVNQISKIDRTILIFRYIIKSGDFSDNLIYSSINALTLNYNQASIKRFSTVPKQNAILTLPNPIPLGTSYNNILKIDGTDKIIPKIISINAPNTIKDNIIYNAGDIILITILFSNPVKVYGIPKLWLELGDNLNYAIYINGDMTNTLLFQYIIQTNDYTLDLSYVDRNSLDITNGAILHLSSNPTSPVSILLPFPGTIGSLDFNRQIIIRGTIPYITKIKFITNDGMYGVDSIIELMITFSVKVIVSGIPYIILETGLIDRNAIYVSGTGTNILIFQYIVKCGDTSFDLDYSGILETSNIDNSIKLPIDASIQTSCSTTNCIPIQNVDLFLNPPGGQLFGSTTINIINGMIRYRNLFINLVAKNYRIYFYSNNIINTNNFIYTTVKLDVEFSAVYELTSSIPTSIDFGSQLGYSVDIKDDTIILGANKQRKIRYDIQTVNIQGSVTNLINEIQILKTSIEHQNEIQQLISTAAPNEKIGGGFILSSSNSVGSTRLIRFDYNHEQLKTILELDLGFGLGTINVDRKNNLICNCQNGYIWTITFLNEKGDVPPLFATNYLTGIGANIGDGIASNYALTLVNSPVLSGTFVLKYNLLTTLDLPYNIDEITLATRIQIDLQIPIQFISRSNPIPDRTFTWTITFGSSINLYDIPELIPLGPGLLGNKAKVQIFTERNGKAPISGSFRLRFLENMFPMAETINISYDATAQTVENALKSLPSIVDVSVSKIIKQTVSTWIITFIQTNILTAYGTVMDSMKNLPPLTGVTVDLNGNKLLKGTDAEVIIGYFDKLGDIGTQTNIGSIGDNTGSAILFKKTTDGQWMKQSNIYGIDSEPQDFFGTSVAIDTNRIIIGSPGARSLGVYEVQEIYCTATSGNFLLSFRSRLSKPIQFNDDLTIIADMLDVSISFILISSFISLCDGDPKQITIMAVEKSDPFGDIEEIIVADMNNLINALAIDGLGSVSIKEKIKGTRKRSGIYAKGYKTGAAYLFHRSLDTNLWIQNIKLIPPNGSSGDLFGESVAIQGNFAVVGAPGTNLWTGAVYIYSWDTITLTWNLFQVLTAAPYTVTKNNRFGQSVSISKTTIIVGCPGYSFNTGAVFVFWLISGVFQNIQMVQGSGLSTNDYFGSSVKLDLNSNSMVVGAPSSQSNSGKAYVFENTVTEYSLATSFREKQILIGSDTRSQDRFGTSVSISKDTIIIGGHEKYSSIIKPRKAVQKIIITGDSMISGYFKLGFRMEIVENNERKSWYRMTDAIPCGVTAVTLENILQNQLNTSEVTITRYGPDSNNGYTWFITFTETDASVPTLYADGTLLTGINVMIDVSLTNPIAPILRGNAYVFTRNTVIEDDTPKVLWIEQATLRPRNKQYSSMFGYSLAIDSNMAVIGAFTSDTYVSGITTGSGFAFDLNFLNIKFSATKYNVNEGSSITITINRCDPICFLGGTIENNPINKYQYINYDTGDAISDEKGKNYAFIKKKIGPFQVLSMLDTTIQDINAFYYSKVIGQEPYPLIGSGKWLNKDRISTATSRSQYYGSKNERNSLWIDWQFDFLGKSDYPTTSGELVFSGAEKIKTITIPTTNDYVYENPNEYFSIRLSLPGIWPSYGGQLWSNVMIMDDGDGGIGIENYYEKILNQDISISEYELKNSEFGKSVDIDKKSNIVIIGSPGLKINNFSRSGAVYIYIKTLGIWQFDAKLVPSDGPKINLLFGSSVSIDSSSTSIRAAVGAPGRPAAYIFIKNKVTGIWSEETKLQIPIEYGPNENIASTHSIKINGLFAIIGCANLERIYVFHYLSNNQWETTGTLLRSSDYDYDTIYNVNIDHHAQFGTSLDMSGRTIVVGAPWANYHSNSIPNTPDNNNIRTDGPDINYLSTGAAYIFHRNPEIQCIKIQFDLPLTNGTFKLKLIFRGKDETTDFLSYNSSTKDIKEIIEKLESIDMIEVSTFGTKDIGYQWYITFLSEVSTVPLFIPLWKNGGLFPSNDCNDCIGFNSNFLQNPSQQLVVNRIRTIGIWEEKLKIQSPDKRHADRFGSVVSIDNNQIIVGAFGASNVVTTTWNFETGDLVGWKKTGTAFNYQPTYGDNTYARSGYDNDRIVRPMSGGGPNIKGERSFYEGRYWIGSYEKRPGGSFNINNIYNSLLSDTCSFYNNECITNDYKIPSIYPKGSFQGDEPKGTLTSQPFLIQGTKITFRMGGGCDINTIYIELLIDGISLYKETGKCREKMDFIEWNVGLYQNKTGQIRAVDDSSELWGHINFDDFKFNWNMIQPNTESSGAAYLFKRKMIQSEESCTVQINTIDKGIDCEWKYDSKLIPSDKRGYDSFGFSVSIDDLTGIAIISAPYQSGKNMNNTNIVPIIQDIGSIYIYKRINEIRDGTGTIIIPSMWLSKEDAKLQTPDKYTYPNPLDSDYLYFGFSLSLSGYTIIIGSPGYNNNNGVIYIMDIRFIHLKFTSNEYFIKENDINKHIAIELKRTNINNLFELNRALSIGYATSDLYDAVGVDSKRYEECLLLPFIERMNCHDYRQTSGILTFGANEYSKKIIIPIMDDLCYEPNKEYIKINLFLPGGDIIYGESFSTIIRIDDDDFDKLKCI